MILLNTTFYIHPSIENDFLSWMKTVYVPSALLAGLSDPELCLLLVEAGEDVSGYALHLRAGDLSEAEAWHDGAGGDVRSGFMSRYGEKALSFSTYMEVIPIL